MVKWREGGFGIPNAENFLISLKTNLISKNFNNKDYWATGFTGNINEDNTQQIRLPDKIDRYHITPYTRDLIINYNHFIDNFYSFGYNNLNERIFEGGKTFFLTQKGDITTNIFTNESRIRHLEKINRITILHLVNITTKQTLDIDNMRVKLGWNINHNEYFHLTRICNNYLRDNKDKIGGQYTNINHLLHNKIKGSKKYRKYIDKTLTKHTGYKTRLKTIKGTDYIPTDEDLTREKQFFKTVGIGYLPTAKRSQFNRVFDNTIIFNGAKSHIYEDYDPRCKSCLFKKIHPCPTEKLNHLIHCDSFFMLFKEVTDMENFHENIDSASMFLGLNNSNGTCAMLFNICSLYYIVMYSGAKVLNDNITKKMQESIWAEIRTARSVSESLNRKCGNLLFRHPQWKILLNTDPNRSYFYIHNG